MKSRLMGATALVLMLGAGAATAQTASAPPPKASGAAAETTVSDIIVTAQRRSETIQRAAIPIAAVSGAMLQSANITDPTRLTTLVPALQITPSTGPFPIFYVRGVGNFAGNALSESAIAFNVDGVYLSRPSSTVGFFYDLDRVEVLKGPQGTLYGRNATGGAINVIIHKPELGVYSGSLAVQYGNFDAIRTDATVNIPLGETAALRASGLFVRHDGYMNDDTDDENDRGGRLLFRMEPNANLTVDLGADYFHQGGHSTGGTMLPPAANLDDRISFLSPQGQAITSHTPLFTLGRFMAPVVAPSFQDNDFWGVNATLEYRTDFGAFTLVPGYRHAKLHYSDFSQGYLIRSTEKDTQSSVEARFVSDETKPLRFLVGGYYLDSKSDVPDFYVNAQFLDANTDYGLKSTSAAAFGRITYAPIPEVRLTVGGRYTREKKNFDGLANNYTKICVVPGPFPACPAAQPFPYVGGPMPIPGPGPDGTVTLLTRLPADFDATFRRFTYRLAADWDVTPNNLLYVSYETGFKSGGFFFTADNGVYRPETIKALTFGSKNTFFDHRLTLNLELFNWNYRDQQQSLQATDSHLNSIFATLNVGRSRNRGAEVEVRFAATSSLLLSADVQYLDAKYNSFTFLVPNTNGGFGNGTGCPNTSVTAANYTVDCSGKRPVNAPKWTVNLGAQNKFALANGGSITPAVNAHYQTQTLTAAQFLPAQYQDAYWMVDATLTYTTEDGKLSFGAYINNAFNETVFAQSNPIPGTPLIAANLRAPRVYGVRLASRF